MTSILDFGRRSPIGESKGVAFLVNGLPYFSVLRNLQANRQRNRPMSVENPEPWPQLLFAGVLADDPVLVIITADDPELAPDVAVTSYDPMVLPDE